jgi:glycosyltransferase involved in cell wall biosynthesis
MPTVLLDARVDRGGVGRYAGHIQSGLEGLGDFHPVIISRARSWLDMPFTPWASVSVARAARTAGADLIHGLHLEIPRSASLPRVVTIHDVIPLEHPASMPSALRRAIFKAILRRSISHADRVIVPSRATATDLVRHGFEGRRVTVIPNAVDPTFEPLTPPEKEIARARFAEGSPYVVGFAQAKAHKNARVLQRVGALIRNEIRFVARTQGESSRDAPVVSGKLSDAELRLLLGGAETMVFPSLIEGFGLPVAEAAACDTAVVCGSRLGVLEELGDAVVQVNVSDPGAIARAVLDLVSDDRGREQRASKAGAIARSLTIQRMARATVDVYESILGT